MADDTQRQLFEQCCRQRASRWDPGPMNDINLLPILNGNMPKQHCSKKVAQFIISIRGVSILPLCWLGIVGAVAIAFVPGVDSISGPYLCRSFILLPNSAVPIDTVSACRCIMGRRWLLFPAVSCVTSRINDRELGHITVLCFYSITKHMTITSVSTRNRPVCHFKTEWRAGFDTPTVYLTFFCLFWGKRFDENGV